MSKSFSVDQNEIMHIVETLMSAASSRYRITNQVAIRAKHIRYEEFEQSKDPAMKAVICAVIEMSDELTTPGIIEPE